MTSAKELPQFVRDMLASPPRAGEGREFVSLPRGACSTSLPKRG